MNGILTPEVLVLGGTGAVGQGVVGALLEAGSPVLVVGRSTHSSTRTRFAPSLPAPTSLPNRASAVLHGNNSSRCFARLGTVNVRISSTMPSE